MEIFQLLDIMMSHHYTQQPLTLLLASHSYFQKGKGNSRGSSDQRSNAQQTTLIPKKTIKTKCAIQQTNTS